MAAATLVTGTYGVRAHTGTDETTVMTGNVKLKGILLTGTAGAETVTIKDKWGSTIMKHVTTVANVVYPFDLYNSVIEGPTVTLSAATVSAVFLVA
jgi:hypothetical protein